MSEQERVIPAALAAVTVSMSFPSPEGRLAVLDHVSLEIPQGSFIALIGPSGCGKTTLIKVLAGLLTPDSGRIIIGAYEEDPRDRIAYMPQSDTLLPWHTAINNAILASRIAKRPKQVALAEAKDLFSRFGLSGFEDLYPTELSGGMRQRLALIRTFLAHRDVLLLDEPLGSLDALTRASLQDWLLSIWQELKKTILLVTHDVEEAALLSDKIILLSARPAHVREVFPVGFPRPRSRTATPLVRLKGEILDLIHAECSDAR
ncbi:MAG: ABC transporter ATP-binding protein [Candidatus Bipolaricaulota bacterium]|nr:ABC transporter ATP-binding protein [Candidatus Bipolaricaulota bacterium]